MKKPVSIVLALLLALSILTVPAMAETENDDGGTIGYLSFLNLSEEEFDARHAAEIPAYQYLTEQGTMGFAGERERHRNIIFYDSLDAMLMGLFSGEVDSIDVPDCTAKYLCAENDQVKQSAFYYPEKAEGFSQCLLNVLCNGYSFMMLEENSDLRDQFDQVIAEMKEDGTLEELIRVYITDAAGNGEMEAVSFEQFEGEPIRVAVTGCLPPMDYVAADGSFAGFNTAILSRIGKRLERNIELKQVDSLGRALALSEGNVDAVFWTRGVSEAAAEEGILSMSEEEYEEFLQEGQESHTEEENAIMEALLASLPGNTYAYRDMPEGTVFTAPYYTDLNVIVTLKDAADTGGDEKK